MSIIRYHRITLGPMRASEGLEVHFDRLLTSDTIRQSSIQKKNQLHECIKHLDSSVDCVYEFFKQQSVEKLKLTSLRSDVIDPEGPTESKSPKRSHRALSRLDYFPQISVDWEDIGIEDM